MIWQEKLSANIFKKKKCQKTYHCSGVVCEANIWCHFRQKIAKKHPKHFGKWPKFSKKCQKSYHCSGVVCEAKSWCHLRQTWPTANNEISSRNLKIPIKTSGGKISTTLSGRESPSFLGNDNWDNWWLRDSTRIGWNKIWKKKKIIKKSQV